jgi:hypothetical protein
MNTSSIILAQLIGIPRIGEHATINLCQHISPSCSYVHYYERSFLG